MVPLYYSPGVSHTHLTFGLFIGHLNVPAIKVITQVTWIYGNLSNQSEGPPNGGYVNQVDLNVKKQWPQ